MFDEQIPPEERAKQPAIFGDYRCKECGEERPRITWVEGTKQRLLREHLCFACDFWLCNVDELSDQINKQAGGVLHSRQPSSERGEIFIINGTWYSDGGAVKKAEIGTGEYPSLLGFGGRVFEIERLDGTTLETNNLWCGGEVPQHFRARIPDNAKFLNHRGAWVDAGSLGKVLV